MRNLIVLLGFLLPMLASAQEWTEHTVDGAFNGANSVYAEDIDGDGDMDMLGAAINSNEITWWENLDGTGLSWSEHTVNGAFDGSYCVYAEDMDGDGDMDVLGAATDSHAITWWENTDGTGLNWSEHTVAGDFDEACSVYAEDVDGDGDMDILGTSGSDGRITWWENLDGTGLSWSGHTLEGEFSNARSVYVEDVNGDGYMDVLGAAYSDDDITWWENLDGTGLNWSEHTVDGDFDGARSVYAEDVDGDGDVDILGAAYLADDITWWENLDGTGLNWSEHTVSGDVDGITSVYAEDVDGDGDMDLLGAARIADDIIWWENLDGTGLDWYEHTLSGEFFGAAGVYAEDVDGDGDMDLLGAAYNADSITWWEQPGSPPIEFTITPINTIVGADGGYITYSVNIINNTGFLFSNFTYWTTAILPNGNSFGPLLTQAFNLRPWQEIDIPLVLQNVPDLAPAGQYSHISNIGMYPVPALTDHFRFIKQGVSNSRGQFESDWSVTGFDLPAASWIAGMEEGSLPTEFRVEDAYPNPFNPTTTIRIALPETSKLTVMVYNITGQQVAELANGQFNAGSHSLTFDASGMSSGLYFVRVSVPGEINQVQKVMLVR